MEAPVNYTLIWPLHNWSAGLLLGCHTALHPPVAVYRETLAYL